jgi:hypothetical protein
MLKRALGTASVWLLLPIWVFAQSLETPQDGSAVSGIGYIRGWKCAATSVTFTIDNSPPAPLPYGSERGDTQGVCGDTNNGFIAQYNWNLLPTGQHTIRVFDTGQQFAQATFTSTNLGTEFLTGLNATCTIGFGDWKLTVTWQEDQQNFVITDFTEQGMWPGSTPYP